MERERGEGFCSCDRGGFAARWMRRAVALMVAGGVGVAVGACRVFGGAARGERRSSFAVGFEPGSVPEPTCPANAKTNTSAPAVVIRLNRVEFDVMLVIRLGSCRSPSPGSPLRRKASEDRIGKLTRCLRSSMATVRRGRAQLAPSAVEDLAGAHVPVSRGAGDRARPRLFTDPAAPAPPDPLSQQNNWRFADQSGPTAAGDLEFVERDARASRYPADSRYADEARSQD